MDFRSDTVTKPTPGMGAAMLQAVLTGATGDDVMGEDATITALEARVAALLGKEAAVFVPTCTMANLLAVGAQCARGEEVLLGTESHIFGARVGIARLVRASWRVSASSAPRAGHADTAAALRSWHLVRSALPCPPRSAPRHPRRATLPSPHQSTSRAARAG